MGAPIGNTNAVNKGQFQSALKRALARKSGKNVAEGLNAVADKLVDAAIDNNEQWAIKEIADRIDGRSAQQLIHTGDTENPVAIEEVKRPTLSKEEWLEKHGIE